MHKSTFKNLTVLIQFKMKTNVARKKKNVKKKPKKKPKKKNVKMKNVVLNHVNVKTAIALKKNIAKNHNKIRNNKVL